MHKLFGAQCLTGGRLRFAWFRDRCTIPNPAQWKDCIKDLSKVWAHLSQGGTPTAAPHNTLLIDDTDGKARLQPRNHLPIPPFDICDPNTQAVNDSTLLRLLDYLRDMHASKVAIDTIDVRDYLAARPFHLQPEVTVLPRDVRPNMRREK